MESRLLVVHLTTGQAIMGMGSLDTNPAGRIVLKNPILKIMGQTPDGRFGYRIIPLNTLNGMEHDGEVHIQPSAIEYIDYGPFTPTARQEYEAAIHGSTAKIAIANQIPK